METIYTPNNNIVAELGDAKITIDDFNDAFLRAGFVSKDAKIDTLAEKREFLRLLVNYRMKLKDAEQRGYSKDPEIIKEFGEYRKSIGAAMLVEKEIVEKEIEKIYDRRKYELRISQIYIKMDSTQADLGLNKAQKILDRINGGEKFEDMLSQFTDDPAGKMNGGDLYYITSGDINIPDMENYLYNTNVGNVCNKVFRTEEGFHIIKVTEKKPRAFGMNVSHILALYKNGNSQPDTLAAKKKIFDAQNELKNGVNFEEVAKKYSDDKVSATKGGSLGVISRGSFVKEFDEVVMNMKEKEVSGIVPTSYGFHIIKINSILPYPSLNEQYESLKKGLDRSGLQLALQNYILSIRDDVGYKLNSSLYETLIAVKDSFYVGDSLFYANIKGKYKDSLFVTIDNKPYVADSLFNFMVNAKDIIAKRFNKKAIDLSHNRYCSDIILQAKALKEYNGNPKFEKILDEYKNGILLFKVNENEIWGKIKVDTLTMRKYWEQTKEKYITKTKVTYREIYLTTAALRDTVYKKLKAGVSFDELIKQSNRPNSEKPKTQFLEEDELAKRAGDLKNVGDYSEPFSYNGGWSIVRLDNKENPRVKTYEEAKAEVSSILQDQQSKALEEEYLNRLRSVYNPKIYPENIKK